MKIEHMNGTDQTDEICDIVSGYAAKCPVTVHTVSTPVECTRKSQ